MASVEENFREAYGRWPFELELTRTAQLHVLRAIQHYIAEGSAGSGEAELQTAANQIRAHLQHYQTDPQQLTDEELLA